VHGLSVLRITIESDVESSIKNDEGGMMNDELKESPRFPFIIPHFAFIIKTLFPVARGCLR